MNEQTVVEDSNTTSDEVVSDDNALDDLLNEYDEGVAETQQTGEQSSDVQELADYVRDKRDSENKQAADSAISDAVKTLKGESNLPDAVFRGMIYDKSSDSRFLKAFTERDSNPQGWNKVIGAMSKEFNDSLPKEDAQLSADREALASAVQSASTNQASEQTTDLSSMSDSEFLRHKAALLRG